MADHDDKAFFGRCVEDSMDTLYRVALRLTRNEADAEDLVAESVVKAWSAFSSLDDKTKVKPWLLRILHNRFISDYRKKSIRPSETSFDENCEDNERHVIANLVTQQSVDFLHWWANPERELINTLLKEEITKAIESLPEAFRATIVLVSVEGLSYDDAAAVMGVPPGTVRSRMKRGRTLLQKALWEQARNSGLVDQSNLEIAAHDA